MAESDTAKARTLYERGPDKSTAADRWQDRECWIISRSMGRGIFSALIVAGLVLAAPAAAKPFDFKLNTKELDFTSQWPAQAAAIPALDRRLRTEMTKALADAKANARDDVKLAREQQRQFNQHYYAMKYSMAGQTPRLLSLESENGVFEGGAHPMTTYDALLWDRRQNRPISVGSLFVHAGDLSSVTRAFYCRALDAERNKRREGEKMDLAEFNACPKFSELAISPVDRDKDGKFNDLNFVASPYVAGPYVEGEYAITVPVTPQFLAALKPEFRSSFELYRQ